MFPTASPTESIRASMHKLMGACCFLAFLITPICRGAILSSGTIEIPGTFLFDFDAGIVPPTLNPSTDVWWEIETGTTRQLAASNGGTLVNLGAVNFNSITAAQLQGLTYGTTGIDGSDGSNLLVVGDVFAVHTNLGSYAKAIVTSPFDINQDNGLIIRWETDTVPDPTSIALLALATSGCLLRRPRIRARYN